MRLWVPLLACPAVGAGYPFHNAGQASSGTRYPALKQEPPMHLERVTTRHSEAGLAGWIASNDVTLFTTALVVAIAIFLQSRVTRGDKENLSLTGENRALNVRLASTSNQLDSVSELLDKTS